MCTKDKLGAVFAVIVILATNSALAGEWTTVSGDEISDLLTGKRVNYAQAHQVFFPSGRTKYVAGIESWGYWQVRDDLYCSQWPPSDLWECYSIEMENDGKIKFIGNSGGTTEGMIVSE